jgi:hypothetical protein
MNSSTLMALDEDRRSIYKKLKSNNNYREAPYMRMGRLVDLLLYVC